MRIKCKVDRKLMARSDGKLDEVGRIEGAPSHAKSEVHVTMKPDDVIRNLRTIEVPKSRA